MHVDKLLLTIVLCATSARCADDRASTARIARTIGSSSSAAVLVWGSRISKSIWPGRPILWEWTGRGAATIFMRLAALARALDTTPMRIEFGPEDGPRAAAAYRRRFGHRGEWLVEQLGNGLGPDARPHGQAVPNIYLSPPPFTSANNFF